MRAAHEWRCKRISHDITSHSSLSLFTESHGWIDAWKKGLVGCIAWMGMGGQKLHAKESVLLYVGEVICTVVYQLTKLSDALCLEPNRGSENLRSVRIRRCVC
jgi:hypothetical protein